MRSSKSMVLGLLSFLSLLLPALSDPIKPRQWPERRSDCLSDWEAATLVSELESLYVKIDPNLAKRILTPDFQQLSYSTLRPGPGTIPPGDVVAANRAQFITQQEAGGTGGAPFQTLNIWHGCDSISFRWILAVTDNTGKLFEYIGIDVLELEEGSYKIKADYSEFSV